MKLVHGLRSRSRLVLVATAAAGLLAVGAPASHANGYGHYIIANHFVLGDPALALVPALNDNVVRGDTLTFRNKDQTPHIIASDDGLFESRAINGGEEWTLSTAGLPDGTYGYHCEIHTAMTGSFTVGAAR